MLIPALATLCSKLGVAVLGIRDYPHPPPLRSFLTRILLLASEKIWITSRTRVSQRVCIHVPNHPLHLIDPPFPAVWISPVSQNYAGPRTAYGDAYHGYWIADLSQLNPRFGTSDDLKALSAELHKRNMYLMVDVVVNNVMSTSLKPNWNDYFFKDPVCVLLPA